MFKKSLFLQPASGFVPLTGAAGLDATAPLATEVSDWAGQVPSRIGWEAPAGVGVGHVELAMLASVCGYFTLGFGRLLGLC